MITKIKNALHNPDGSLNGKIIASLISLSLVLIQQLLAVFGLKFTGDMGNLVSGINTILTILGLLGVIENTGTVEPPK